MVESKKNSSNQEPKNNKQKTLDATISTIEKQFGKGSIMRLDNDSSVKNVESVSSGSIALDHALGVGGFPRGRVIEIYGPEASGKTTLALHAIAETQRSGGITAFVDAEHAFDPTYSKGLGIVNEELLISQPDYGEQAMEIVDQLIRSSAVDMIVIDSVAALTPK
ncbi:DNA recombination/repair protein RecA, partial [bacterium]|nr:DNA recombination/repair protein RecA [bacterium]